MKLYKAHIRGFRRLENVSIDFEDSETVFVGPNNSGKTSATEVFRLFLRSGEFSAYDFSVANVALLDKFGRGEIDEKDIPCIELDLWFSINPDTEFGRIGLLLPDAEQDYETVGIRLRYMVKDAAEMIDSYKIRMRQQDSTEPSKSLAQYLVLPGALRQHFSLTYYSLSQSQSEQNVAASPLPPDDARKLIRSLLRVEFVEAERPVDDSEYSGNSRLSKVFTGYYHRHLTQAEASDQAYELIDKHNNDLTAHYASVFSELLGVIQELGVPSVNDRPLRLISSLIPETVLKSNTTLAYRDDLRNHDLPENYNGLGFKHLIYLAVQICDYHINWIKTDIDRPLALVIFIEEPEVHLHAQAQQVFIQNAWKIIRNAAERFQEEDKIPQLVVTTHSSHMLDTVDFSHVRYFRRECCSDEDPATTRTLNASSVLNLKNFDPLDATSSSVTSDESKAAQDFLKRYLKLTHCDLFFADAAILIEGTVEKLLLPSMIERVASGLRKRYLTILEVGGAYAHQFAGLFEFLSIPYLVITDIDSVDPSGNRVTCRADTEGAVTSNAAIRFFLSLSTISELTVLGDNNKHIASRKCFVAYQTPTCVSCNGDDYKMHGRTLEETFVYENISLFRDGSIDLGADFPQNENYEEEYKIVYDRIKSASFKKAAFALSVLSSDKDWIVPAYITQGLLWLADELDVTAESTEVGVEV